MFSVNAMASLCATVYQGAHLSGNSLEIMDREDAVALDNYFMDYRYDHRNRAIPMTWDNKISSIVVAPNCKLKVYQYENYGVHYHTGRSIGDRHTYKNRRDFHSKAFQLGYLDNKISSLSCHCW